MPFRCRNSISLANSIHGRRRRPLPCQGGCGEYTRRRGRSRSAPEAVGDPSAGEVVRGELDLHGVAEEDADAVLAQLAAEIGEQLVPVGQAHLELGIGQGLDDFAGHLDCIGQNILLDLGRILQAWKSPCRRSVYGGATDRSATRTGVHCPTDDAVRQTFMDADMRIPSPDASAPGCCDPPLDPRIARHFDEKAGAWTDGEAFPEMVDVSAALLDLLRDTPLRRPSVLELGCGTGGLSVALLEMGAARVTGIDLSTTSIEVASRRAQASGFAAQASFRHGNAATADVEPHDLVILDRVKIGR